MPFESILIRPSFSRSSRKRISSCSFIFNEYPTACCAGAPPLFDFRIYHFVKTHKELRIEADQKEKKWIQRTPMMAAGITDHVWTLSELINFRVEQN